MDIDYKLILDESKHLNNNFKLYLINNNGLDLEKFKSNMKEMYSYTYNNLESVFDMALSESYNYKRLEFMLSMNNKIKKKEISEKEASIQVGQLLVDEIVKPNIKK
tara:strand:+ start:259 stop:576 length:318 start_codon:yes stop_codon:yes gene_type:complete